jgi:hypothetical protein
MPPALITPMLIGAAVGAVSAAIQGGNILKGALFGALGGAVGGALTGALGAAGSAAAGAEAGALGGAEAGAAAAIPDAAAGAMGGGADAALTASAGALESGVAPGMIGDPAAAAAGAAPGTGVAALPPDTGIGGAPTADTGVANAMDVRLANGQTPGTGLSVVDQAGGTSFLDDLMNKGKGMLNSRFATDTAGQMLKGWAGGRQQQAAIDARRADIADARSNARFGNVGSRYNPGGMIHSSGVTYTPRKA